MLGFIEKAVAVVYRELAGDAPDQYITIPAASDEKKEVVPFARHSEVPYLGEDHEQMIKKAESLYSDDTNRLRWLKALHKMRNNNVEWIMQPMTAEELKKHNSHADLYPKWNFNPPAMAA